MYVNEFAANGGTIIATGETGLYNHQFEARNSTGLNCLGIEHVKEIKSDLMSSIFEIPEAEKDLFPRCMKTPLIAPGPNLVMVEPKENVNKYLRLIPEHAFGPPEICYYNEVSQEPGILVSKYHKGRAVYIPWKIGTFYHQEGYQNTLNIIQDILFSLCGIEEIAPDLTPMIVNICRNKEQQIIQLVNNSGCFANSYFSPIPINNISLRLKGVKESVNIEPLRGGKAECQYKDGYLNINLDVLKDYEARSNIIQFTIYLELSRYQSLRSSKNWDLNILDGEVLEWKTLLIKFLQNQLNIPTLKICKQRVPVLLMEWSY
ncbi:hypothetical protein [Shouchella tritolerans]|uniref:hypothetical protein n=1 Tax=Shouchella tritolerans TaxID=2979466 RepID=UPI0021E87131|nr:hypothetical protein [Shouchella tritolerans]